MTTRIEVAARVSGRRRWTVEQKLVVLRDAFGPDGSVRTACERHDVGSGQVYSWRRQAMSGELTGKQRSLPPVFTEVEVAEPPLPVVSQSGPGSRQIGIELPSGVKVTVGPRVDADALALVMGVLTR